MIIIDLGGGLNPRKEATLNLDFHRMNNNFPFLKHDLNTALPFDSESIDKFIMDNVLEHLDISPESIFKDVNRCLKVNGVFEIIVPNTLFWTYRLQYLFGMIPKDFILAHKKHFSYSMIEFALKNSGFKIDLMKNLKSFNPLRNIFNNQIKFIARRISD